MKLHILVRPLGVCTQREDHDEKKMVDFRRVSRVKEQPRHIPKPFQTKRDTSL